MYEVSDLLSDLTGFPIQWTNVDRGLLFVLTLFHPRFPGSFGAIFDLLSELMFAPEPEKNSRTVQNPALISRNMASCDPCKLECDIMLTVQLSRTSERPCIRTYFWNIIWRLFLSG
ncbi:hypothetical protein AMECASPLE_027900 [Ameca splendens]|uniref:Uncharacterized protein n=1 Tax=Ameca splendens TaxID=208324 RepID=A0ABV0XUQ8_9TELE